MNKLRITADTPVWRVGAVATIFAAIATELFGTAGRLLDVPMEAGNFTADEKQDIFVGGFAFSTVQWGIIGTIVAVVLARKARRPERTWIAIASVGTLLTLAFPLTTTSDTTTATQVVLVLSHFLAGAVIIPPLARRLSLVDPATRKQAANDERGRHNSGPQEAIA